MRMVDTVTLSGAGLRSEAIKLSDIYDPFVSATYNNQPLGSDQYVTFYNKFVVVGAKMTVRFHNSSATVTQVVGIHLRDPNTSTSYGSFEHMIEQKATTYRVLSPDIDHTICKMKYSAKRWNGVKSLTEAEDLHGVVDTSSPTEYTHALVFAQDLKQSSDAAVDALIQIDFLVLLFDRKVLTRST